MASGPVTLGSPVGDRIMYDTGLKFISELESLVELKFYYDKISLISNVIDPKITPQLYDLVKRFPHGLSPKEYLRSHISHNKPIPIFPSTKNYNTLKAIFDSFKLLNHSEFDYLRASSKLVQTDDDGKGFEITYSNSRSYENRIEFKIRKTLSKSHITNIEKLCLIIKLVQYTTDSNPINPNCYKETELYHASLFIDFNNNDKSIKLSSLHFTIPNDRSATLYFPIDNFVEYMSIFESLSTPPNFKALVYIILIFYITLLNYKPINIGTEVTPRTYTHLLAFLESVKKRIRLSSTGGKNIKNLNKPSVKPSVKPKVKSTIKISNKLAMLMRYM